MPNLAIRTTDLGKRYSKGSAGQQRYETLREAVLRPIIGGFRWHERVHEEFWALRHLDVEISHGEAVGIIGRNGAGKSTLLKILSRVTDPSEGDAEIYGRLGALLEVGTGFHPELSGRENIWLAGMLLGFKKTDIRRRFD